VGRNFIDNSLRKTTGQGRWCNSVLWDSYDRLADFVVSKFIAERRIFVRIFDHFVSILSNLFNEIKCVHLRVSIDKSVKLSGLAWIGLVGKYCRISR